MVSTRSRPAAAAPADPKQTTLDAAVGDKRVADAPANGSAKKRKSGAADEAESRPEADGEQAEEAAQVKATEEVEQAELAKGGNGREDKGDVKAEEGGEPQGAKEEEKNEEDNKTGDVEMKGEEGERDQREKEESKDEPEERKAHEAEAAESKEDEVGAEGAAKVDGSELVEPKHGTLESGHIYFLYRPKVETEDPESIDDVSKFYIVLLPKTGTHANSKFHRLITVGKKQLPEQGAKHQVIWGSVQATADDMADFKDALGAYEYDTKTMGKRHQPGARPVARGHYILHSPRDGLADDPSTDRQRDFKVLLAYSITTPTEEEFGNVQKELHIVSEGTMALQVKDPNVESGNNPRAVSLPKEKRAKYPEDLQSIFRNRRWVPANPPAFLDYTGTELLLISTPHKIDEALGKDGDKVEHDLDAAADKERTDAAGAIAELGMSKGDTEVEALEGHWA